MSPLVIDAMSRPFLAALLLPATLACAATACQQAAPPATLAASTLPAPIDDLVAQGEYLVRIGGCNDCHTAGYAQRGGEVPMSDWLTGSPLGYHGPWGTTYATNLRLTIAGLDEAQWLAYTANLHTRPIMPDFMLRAMREHDRRAIYRFVRSLGAAGDPAPPALPPGTTPEPPYFQLVAPTPGPDAAGTAPPVAAHQGQKPVQ